jgi:FixJ family two-component response regulator
MAAGPTRNGRALAQKLGLVVRKGNAMAKKPMIAIVEDDESVRAATISLVRSAGFESEAFSCADEFLKSGDPERTACLIADVQMPGMSGLELHGHLLRSGSLVPTVLITAYPNDNARSRAIESGVICYLTKPFDENELLECVQSAIQLKRPRS